MATKKLEARTSVEAPRVEASAGAEASIPDWTKADHRIPRLDKYRKEYLICVKTRYTSTGGDLFDSRLREAATQGVESLLEYYNKQLTAASEVDPFGIVEQLLGHAEIRDWHLDPRPGCGGKLKVLIAISAPVFDSIPEELQDLRKLARDAVRTITLNTSKLKRQIKIASRELKKYSRQIKKWPGTVKNLDLEKEAERLEKVIPALKKFLKENDKTYREDHEDHIEIGFGADFSIDYIVAFSSPGQNLTKGISTINEISPFSRPRTMGLLYYIYDIESASKTNMPWTQFCTNFIYPVPDIRPGQIPSLGANPMGALDRVTDSLNKNPIKTLPDLEMENLKLNDVSLKQQLFEVRSQAVDFIGDSLLQNLREVIEEIESLDDVFEKLLNKVDLSTISGQAMNFLASQVPTLDFISSMTMGILSNLEFGDLKNIILPQFPSDIYDKIMEEVYGLDFNLSGIEGFDGSFFELYTKFQDLSLITKEDIIMLIRNAMPEEKVFLLTIDGLKSPSFDVKCLPTEVMNEFLRTALENDIELGIDIMNPSLDTDALTGEFTRILENLSVDALRGLVSNLRRQLVFEVIACIPLDRLLELLDLPSLIINFKFKFNIPDLDFEREKRLILRAIELYGDLEELFEKLPDLLPNINIPNIDIPDLPKIPSLDIPDLSMDFSIPKIPKIPSFEIAEMPTFDLNVDLPAQITTAITDMLEELLIDTSKNVLIDLLDYIEDMGSSLDGNVNNFDFDSPRIGDLLSDSVSTTKVDRTEPETFDDTSTATGKFPSEAIDKILDDMELDVEYVSEDGEVLSGGASRTPEERTKRRTKRFFKRRSASKNKRFHRFIDQISQSLTRRELGNLLEGKAKREVLETAKDCAEDNDIEEFVDDSVILDFFDNIGKNVDPLILAGLKLPSKKLPIFVPSSPTSRLPEITLCNNGDLQKIIGLLSEKAGNITREQIEEAASKIINRKKQKIKNLSYLSSKDNLLEGMNELSVFDGPNRLVKNDPTSLRYLTKKTINTIFTSAENAISIDLGSAYENFIRLEDVPYVENQDYFLSPQMEREDPQRYRELKNEKENSFKSIARVSPEVYDALRSDLLLKSRNLDSGDGFVNRSRSHVYEIKIPSMINEPEIRSRLQKEINDLENKILKQSKDFMNTPIRDIGDTAKQRFEQEKEELRNRKERLDQFSIREFGGSAIKIKLNYESVGNSWDVIRDRLDVDVDDFGSYKTSDTLKDDPKLLEDLSRYELRSEAPAQQEVFARIFMDSLLSLRDTYSAADSCDPEQGLYYTFLDQYYHSIFLNTLGKFVREVAKSEFFQIGPFQDLMTSISMLGMEQETAGPDGFVDDQESYQNNYFIDIESVKDKVERRYKEIRDKDGIASDSLTKASIEGVLESFIKVLGADVLMRGIFGFSVYDDKYVFEDPLFEEVVSDLVYGELLKDSGMERVFAKELKKAVSFAKRNVVKMTGKPRVQQEMASLSHEHYKQIIEAITSAIKQLELSDDEYAKCVSLKDRLTGGTFNPRHHFIRTVDLWKPTDPGEHFYIAPAGFAQDPNSADRSTSGKFSKDLVESIGAGGMTGFVYEKYISVQGYTKRELKDMGHHRTVVNRLYEDFGGEKKIFNLDEFEDYLKDLGSSELLRGNDRWRRRKLSSFFKSIDFGIRLSFVDAGNKALYDEIAKSNKEDRRKPIAVRENAGTAMNGGITRSQGLVIIPLISAEETASFALPESLIGSQALENNPELKRNVIDMKFLDILNAITTKRLDGSGRFLRIFKHREVALKDIIYNDPKFNALFNFSFPTKKFVSIAILYSVFALTRVEQEKSFFMNTRESLRMLLRTLMGISDFQYEDDLIRELGGLSGFLKRQMNLAGIDGSLPNLAAIAAKTPLYILKGLVEITDPNISISSKMVKAAELIGEEYPGGSTGAAMSLLPVNVFPPPPFGPGIGPPITPPGFVYLAFDGVRTPYERAKRNMSRKDRKRVEEAEKMAEEIAKEESERIAEEIKDEVTERAQEYFDRFVNGSDSTGTSEVAPEDPCD
jgi:hypothetical protein